jgi:hypothetical protein
MRPEPTFGTICSDQVTGSHILLDFLSVHCLYKMRDDVIVVLIESFQLCIALDFASVILDMLAENTLDPALAETKRIKLLRRYEYLIVSDIGKLTIGKAGVCSIGGNASAVPTISESPVPIAHNLRVGTGIPNESISGRTPNIR